MSYARGHREFAGLTNRQWEVWELLAQGYSNRAIAQRMTITVKSVENLINQVYCAEGPSDPEMQPPVFLAPKHLERRQELAIHASTD